MPMVRELYATGITEVATESLAADWRDESQRDLARKVFALAEGHGLTWARENMFKNIFALEDTTIGNAIVVLMTPHQAMMRGALLTDTAASPPQIMIGPHAVSRRWAGIVLAHELVHVHDVLNGVEPPNPDESEWFAGEARSYRWESQLVDALSGGKFADHVVDVLVAHPLATAPTEAAVRVVAATLRTATFVSPLSATELAQQNAFCAVAALFARRGELWRPGGPGHDMADLKIVRDMK